VTPEPVGELHAGFSAEGATTVPWAEASRCLEDADIAWLSTVRPDGRPHVTPVIFVWLDDAAYVTTGTAERKARNLEHNGHCVITTGRNTLDEGLDVVVEGDAFAVADPVQRQRVADRFAEKYLPRERASVFHEGLRDGTFITEDRTTVLYEVRPSVAFGFGKGAFSQTRWRF
jgi:nitroimidazol reductase NimA-like FMN-containing flavoprotein (pyridoxamine 5'-phosphate oxidase superfamily)